MERNLYIYTNGNPVNRTDPSGLFSPSMIAKSYGFSSFDALLDAFDHEQKPFYANTYGSYDGKRWGWLALMLDARIGDRVDSYYLDLMQTYPSMALHNSGSFDLSHISDNIGFRVSRSPANQYPLGLYSMQRYSDLQDIGNYDAFMLWRDASPHTYRLNGKTYVDYSPTHDLADLRTVVTPAIPVNLDFSGGLGIAGGGSLLVDRFGNMYIAGSLGAGVGFNFGSYSESYIAPDAETIMFLGYRNLPTEDEIKSIAFCITVSGGFLYGGSTGLCPYERTGLLPGRVAGILTFSVGANASLSDEFNLTFTSIGKNSAMGWNNYLEYRANGITRADVERKALLQIGACP